MLDLLEPGLSIERRPNAHRVSWLCRCVNCEVAQARARRYGFDEQGEICNPPRPKPKRFGWEDAA